MSYPFNVRVYGILISQGRVLISREYFHKTHIVKFPGGGLQFGEGPMDCLIREFKEEAGVTIQIAGHLYTTDFFNPSAFDPSKQVISIYYLVKTNEPINDFFFNNHPSSNNEENDWHYLQWLPLAELQEDIFTFAADKKAALLLKQKLTGINS